MIAGALVIASWITGASTLASAPASEGVNTEPRDLVRVGMIRYDGGKVAQCFADQFLQLVDYETDIDISRQLWKVDAHAPELFDHPFAIMSGEGPFELSEAEVQNLRSYLEQGGFLLASAGCSNNAWTRSMERAIARIFPEIALQKIAPDHEVFSTLYDIQEPKTSRQKDALLLGLSLDGRLTIVFSPNGLNDTAAAARGCCCCGGSEVRKAKHINANILVYALLR